MNTSTFSTQASSGEMNVAEVPLSRKKAYHRAAINAFVGGLPAVCTQDQLTKFMSQFGYVKEVYISKDTSLDGHKGFAFVNFAKVHSIRSLFGIHQLNGRPIEVKRSLQEYLKLKNVPSRAKEEDILEAFKHLGYKVVEVLLGGDAPGVPLGVAGVRLSKFYHQERISKRGVIHILDQEVHMELHVPKRKLSANSPQQNSIKNLDQRPRSFTEKDTSSLTISPTNDCEPRFLDQYYQTEFLAFCQQQALFADLNEKKMANDISDQSCSGLVLPHEVSALNQADANDRIEQNYQGFSDNFWPVGDGKIPSLEFWNVIPRVSSLPVVHRDFHSNDVRIRVDSDFVPKCFKREVLIQFYTFPGQL